MPGTDQSSIREIALGKRTSGMRAAVLIRIHCARPAADHEPQLAGSSSCHARVGQCFLPEDRNPSHAAIMPRQAGGTEEPGSKIAAGVEKGASRRKSSALE